MDVLCACGCGNPTIINLKGKQNKYVHGHNRPWLGKKRGPIPEAQKEKMRISHTGKKYNVSEAGHLQILENIKKAHTPEAISKMRESLIGRKLTKDHIKKSRRSGRPTSIEKEMISIISELNLPYLYTGNGTVKFGRLNPDFININGEKIALEVYAKIYKEIDGRCIEMWKRKRIDKFAEFGWRIYFFDETQITKEFVSETLGGDYH